jgi:hypothetical protein
VVVTAFQHREALTDPAICTHPPTDYYTWHAYDCFTGKKDWLVIVCCQCNTVLKGSTQDFERHYGLETAS